MEIKELTKLCNEYETNKSRKERLEFEISVNTKYPHLDWAVNRDVKAVTDIVSRQIEIAEVLVDVGNVTF